MASICTQGASPAAKVRQTRSRGVWTDQITGSFRKISVHQLTMAWWCFQAKHITKRQLRVYFAAHEMAARRRFNGSEHCRFPLEEVKRLVGGRGSQTADAELARDVRRLARLGLVTISEHAIAFAVSIEQIHVEEISGFWTMFNAMPHQRRSVPVPRRMLRALAAGYTTGVTAVVLATMIRSLFWHKQEGGYRTDGRTKRKWIADVFGVSMRTVTDAKARLTELGWLIPLDTPQWLLNRYGAHDRINIDWIIESNHESSGGGVSCESSQGESASPRRDLGGGSASPDLTDSSSSNEEELNTRRPAQRADSSGASLRSALGSRKKKSRRRSRIRSGEQGGVGGANIRDIQTRDLTDTGRLLELHRQAVELGLAKNGEGGRLDFVSLAERARTRGKNPGAMFFWLLRDKKTAFITQADEDEAARRIKTHLYGDSQRREQWGGEPVRQPRSNPPEWSDDEKVVLACIQTARKHRVTEPFSLARQVKGWTKDRWDSAVIAYESKRMERFRFNTVEFPEGE